MLSQDSPFAVATIKPAVPDSAGSSGEDGNSGLLKVYNVSLRRCIRYAYGIPEGQIAGGLRWVDDLRFDITAKADYPASEPELLKMLQPLLADRFNLMLHHEMRPISGYALTVAKGGIKAKVSDPDRPSGSTGARGQIDAIASPMSLLAIRLSTVLGRPVVDKTTDVRKFDFHLRWNPDDASATLESTAFDGPSLFTALEEQAGLKLVSQRVSADVLVIDHADLPSEN